MNLFCEDQETSAPRFITGAECLIGKTQFCGMDCWYPENIKRIANGLLSFCDRKTRVQYYNNMLRCHPQN